MKSGAAATMLAALRTADHSDPHSIIGKPARNIGYLRSGININFLPDETRLDVDIRTIACQDPD